MVARLLWEQDAAGSNPVTSTILRNNLSYKNSLPNRRAVFVSMPGKPIISGFPGFFCFPGTWRIRPPSARLLSRRSYSPMVAYFCTPCPAFLYQKRGNAKKYPSPDSATSFNENNLAGTLRLPLFLIPARKPLHNLRRLH